MRAFAIEQTYQGLNVRQWKVVGGGKIVRVRESALYPRVYACLTCHRVDCEHANAVREFDAERAA